MTRDDAIAIIQQGLGFRTDLQSQAAVAMDRAIKEFEGPHRTLPKFLIQEDEVLNIVALTQNVALPTGFLRMVENEGPGYTTTQDGRVFLPRQDYDVAERYYIDVENGRPRSYVLRKNAIRFYPIPDVAYALTWSYYKSDPLPTAGNQENSWLANWPYLVIGRAGMFLSEDTQQVAGEDSAFTRFARMYSDWNRIWVSQIAGEADDNAPRAMGSSL